MKIYELLEALEREPVQLTKEQKKQFLETVRNYPHLGESVYSKTNLKELSEKIKNIVEVAQQMTLAEGDLVLPAVRRDGYTTTESIYGSISFWFERI